MASTARPYVREMIAEAIGELGPVTTNTQLGDWILAKYPGTNKNTVQTQIVVCTVNHPSRIHYPENSGPRHAEDERYDLLYRPDRGKLERYDPSRHGLWQILETEEGSLRVAPVSDAEEPITEMGRAFAAEDHLRDYLARNLSVIEEDLELYVDENGLAGVEYTTPIGRIDLLTLDRDGAPVIIELKVGRSPDSVAAQALRYLEWVTRNLENGRSARAFIVAHHISDRIRYAVASNPRIHLKEYELQMSLRDYRGLPSTTDARARWKIPGICSPSEIPPMRRTRWASTFASTWSGRPAGALASAARRT